MKEITDYAQHLIKLDRLLRQTHDLCTNKQYAGAGMLMPDIIAEARLLTATLAIMDSQTSGPRNG